MSAPTALRRVLPALLLIVALVAPATSVAHARPVRPTQEGGGGAELRDDYAEVTREEAELLADLDAARDEQGRLQDRLTTLRDEEADAQKQALEAAVELADAEETARLRREERTEAEAKVREAKDRLRKQIVDSYVRGGTTDSELLGAVLQADSSAEASSAVTYSKVVLGDSEAVVADLQHAREEREEAENVAREARADAEQARDDRTAAAELLTAARSDQEVVLAEVDAQVRAEEAAVQAIKAQKVFIEGQIESLQRTSDAIADLLGDDAVDADTEGIASILITHPMPEYEPGSEFGLRTHPILGTTRLHAGVDIGAPSGATIYAPADGLVVSAGARGGYGNATIIDHGSGLATLYGHQSVIDVTAGQQVKRGDPIGRVGSTGLSTGPHLHFETRIGGTPVDPESIVDFALPEVSYEAEAAKAAADQAELARLLEEYQATLDAEMDSGN